MAPNRKNLASVLQALSNSDLEIVQNYSSVANQQSKFLPLTDPSCEESKDQRPKRQEQQQPASISSPEEESLKQTNVDN